MIAVSTTFFGGIIFLVNVSVLFVIIKIASSRQTKNDKVGFFIHIFFVCIIDTYCGLNLFLLGLINVEGQTSARVCAFTLFASFSAQVVSQGNIACVCIQRFIITKHVEKVQIGWKSSYTKTLIVVNSLIGIISLLTLQTQSINEEIPYEYGPCRGTCVMGPTLSIITAALFFIGFILTIVGDVFCVLTFCKLRKYVNMTVQSDTNTTGSITDNQPNANINAASRIRQQMALRTLLLIVASFNISLLAYILGNVQFILHTALQSEVYNRILLFTLFINSLLNPVVVATRMKVVRIQITTLLSKALTYLCSFYGQPNRRVM